MQEPLILAIDQGTTGSTVAVLTPQGQALARASVEFPQHFPEPGWVEHEPEEIWQSVLLAMERALSEVPSSRDRVQAIGITNQRETTLLWDRRSIEPVHRAIVWQDRRTSEMCALLRERGQGAWIRERTGLVLDPYFSATKLRWLLDTDSSLQRRAEQGQLVFGTVDSYLVSRLSKDGAGRIEMTNASRTLLFDLEHLGFSEGLAAFFGIPQSVLPRVCASDAHFGVTSGVPGLRDGIPITGVLGDQHAALFGQGCLAPGEVKCTYGTGAFVLMNTGSERLLSRHGLLTTLAYSTRGATHFALEGSAFTAGALVQWLRDGLGVIESAAEIEALARSVESSEGLVFVPALSGLGAPHWDPGARGMITGITRGTTKAHLARATLEAIALQVTDLVRAMDADSGSGSTKRRMAVDGGAARNDLLLELQASLCGYQVDRPSDIESTVRGAGLMAALGAGLLRDLKEAREANSMEKSFVGTAPSEVTGRLKAAYADSLARARSNFHVGK